MPAYNFYPLFFSIVLKVQIFLLRILWILYSEIIIIAI